MPHAIVPKTSGSPQPTQGRCGAKLKFTDPPRYCRKWPMKGRTRCERCGGKSPVGPDAPSFRHGRKSRYGLVNPRVFERFAQSLQDETLLDLKPDIAMLEVLAEDATAGVEAGASAEGWKAVREVRTQLRGAKTREQVRTAMARLDALLDGPAAAALAREEAARHIERRAKVVRAHRQLEIEAGDMIPAKRVSVFLATLAALVREFIDGAERRRAFSDKFLALLGPRLQGQIPGEAGQ